MSITDILKWVYDGLMALVMIIVGIAAIFHMYTCFIYIKSTRR